MTEKTNQHFTLEQIKAAHAKVKSGADFPAYIQEIKKLGLITYVFMVKDGTVIYHGADDYEVKSGAIYPQQTINEIADSAALKNTISIHQQGKTDFLTFCNQAARAGVEKWEIDTIGMVCNYLDLNGDLIVAEPIPAGNY